MISKTLSSLAFIAPVFAPEGTISIVDLFQFHNGHVGCVFQTVKPSWYKGRLIRSNRFGFDVFTVTPLVKDLGQGRDAAGFDGRSHQPTDNFDGQRTHRIRIKPGDNRPRRQQPPSSRNRRTEPMFEPAERHPSPPRVRYSVRAGFARPPLVA